MYKVNDAVVHENGVVYRITSIGTLDFTRDSEIYYTMHPVWDDGSTIYVKAKNDKVNLRPVMSKKEAEECLEYLTGKDSEYVQDTREREKNNRDVLRSCGFEEYYLLLKGILQEQERRGKNKKTLNAGDEKALQKTEKMLASELSVIFEITPGQAVENLRAAFSEQVEKEEEK